MEQIYGIDLAQKKFDVSYQTDDGKNGHKVIKNDLQGIIRFLESLPENVLLCAEHTGVCGELLLFLCTCLNVPIALTTGYQIKHSLGLQRGKSDKVDSIRIREYGERFRDKLVVIDYPSESMKELKELLGLRFQLVKERKMLLTHERRTVHLPFNSVKIHQVTLCMLNGLDQAISEIEDEMKHIIDANIDLRKNYMLVTDIIGIGQITACDLIVKTDNFTAIRTAKKAASYAGICPFPNSSGEMVRKSKVSRMADKELKSLLYMCAVSSIRSNPECKLYYARKKLEGKPYFLIMNNISNKLLRTIYAVIKTGKRYQLGHITEDPRLSKKVA